MLRRASSRLLTALLLLLVAACGPEDDPGMPAPNPAGSSCGMSFSNTWTGGPTNGRFSPDSFKSLDELARLGIRQVTFLPVGWMETLRSTEVKDFPRWLRDTHMVQIRKNARRARELGMKVMVKPHVLVGTGKWVANVDPDKLWGGWGAWFKSYEAFITVWAELAEQVGADYFSVGTELRSSAYGQPQRWREMLTRIRKKFSGKWTYTAHFSAPEKITWWNHLDVIGVAMFGPLSDREHPSAWDLRAGAVGWLERYERLAHEYQLPLMLTEVGFANREGTAVEPWKWPSKLKDPKRTDEGDRQQRQAYEAIISTFGHSARVEAIFWWKWFDDPAHQETKVGVGFAPRGKPAEKALAAECAP